MTPPTFRVLDLVGLGPALAHALQASDFGPFEVGAPESGLTADDVDPGWDAVILPASGAADGPAAAHRRDRTLALDVALIVVVAQPDLQTTLHWLQRGAQEVLSTDELAGEALPRRIRAAIERKRLDRESRRSYATDLDTGLPHQQQLIEHMSQLLALREREPSPMAVLVLRVEGLASVRSRFGAESASALRRKVAVRLRAGVRASDVVASLGDDTFGVLLGAMLLPADAPRVAAKLLAALLEPFKVAGQDVALAAAIGVGAYPEDGAQPEVLLRRAMGLAVATPVQGRLGLANFDERGGMAPAAANDD